MASTAQQTTETRRTGWIAFDHYGRTHYRIWTQFDGRTWWQRHEWKFEDGTTEADAWIHGTSCHCRDSEPVLDAA